MADESTLIHGDPECQYKHFVAKVGEPINPDADIDIECFMSTDSVDSDDEVMLPNGVDLSRFNKNPVVMLCHAMGQPGCYYPLPVGRAPWTRQVKRGVLAGVRFTDKTEMGREVKALFDDDMLRSFSVGFRPLEASAMTRKEAESRPDWQAAFERTKGHVRVHRRWHLVELSVAPVPSNEDALRINYKAKGILVPSWLNLKSKANTMDDEPEEVEEKGEGAECSCGKADCSKCGAEKPPETKAEEEPEEAAEAEVDPDDDFDEADESTLPVKTRDHVDVRAKGFRGCGMVEKIHRRGMVDHVDEDVIGTKDEPAARVRLYKAHGDGHMPSEQRRGFRLKELTKRPEPFKAPSRGKALAADAAEVSPIGETADDIPGGPLPPLVCLSDYEIAQKALAEVQNMPQRMQEELYRLVGGV